MINESHQADQPLILKDKKLPNEKLMTRLIKDEFRFERRQYIFLNVNTVNLVLTLYNLFCPINIEGQRSLIFYEEVRQLDGESDLTLLNLLDTLIVVHLLRIFTCLLGYFSVSQKSGRIITYFMIMSTICVLCRGIVSLLIILNYDAIKTICQQIFDSESQVMAVQFLVVLILFVIVEILLALVSLIQCSKSKDEYAGIQLFYFSVWVKHKEKMLKNYDLCYEIAAYQLDE